MKRAYSLVVVSALLVLTLAMGSCGGQNAGLNPADGNAGFIGITEGGFRAVRYNDAGYADSSLNGTMDLNVARLGDTTTVSVEISDSAASIGVMLDLGYDADRYQPVDVQFDGLVDTPIEMAATQIAGTVGLGQVGNKTTGTYKGRFATVTFRNQPFARTVSSAAGAYTLNAVNTQYPALNSVAAQDGFVLTDSDASDGTDVAFDVYAIFAAGDGNSDSQTLVSDLATIGQIGLGAQTSATDLIAAIGDYNHDGTVSVQDLTPIGLNFQHGYTGVEVLLGDSNDFSAGGTVAATLDFAAGAAPTTDYATPTTDFKDIFRNWSGTIPAATVQAADTDQDGTVFISARVVDSSGPSGAQQGPAFTGMPVTAGQSLPSDVVVGDFTLAIDGGTGGTGLEGNEFADGTTASVVANSTLNLYVAGIAGAYQGNPFTSADAGTVIPQAVYDQALQAVQQQATFAAQDAGDANMLKTGSVITVGAFNTEGYDATVFPDDDPESTGASAEASITATLAANGTGIPGTIAKTVMADVTADPDAATFTAINTPDGQDGQGNWIINAAVNTTISIPFTFGAQGAPGSFDGTTCPAELYDYDAGTTTALNYVEPPADPLDYHVRDGGGGNFAIEAIVSPSNLIAGHHYIIRFKPDPGHYNSINKPGELLLIGDLPPATPMEILPSDQIDSATNQISLYYPDPQIRRNGAVNIVIPGFGIEPDFPGAFDDVLKTSGDSFIWQAASGGGVWPEITILQTPTVDDITASTNGIEGVILLNTQSNTGYVSVDIAALPDPASNSSITYSFKLFGKPITAGDQSTRPEIGSGTFTVNGLSVGTPAILGVDYGLNIFDDMGRGDADLASADFSDKTLTLSSLVDSNTAGSPDVLFVQWSGGRVLAPADANNIHIVATDEDGLIGSQNLPLEIRVVGLGAGGTDYLGIYPFTSLDNQSNGGIFTGGINYDLVLSDGVSTDFPFAAKMACSN